VSQAGPSAAPAGDVVAVVTGPAGATRRRWAVFWALAAGVVIVDQATKAWILTTLDLGESIDLLDGWLSLRHVANSGALFGLFQDQAILFAALSIGVMGLIAWFHGRTLASGGWLATVALGLLLGGAVGNFIDRVRLGHVVDFVDMGFPDGWRFYTWNVADSAITVAILLLLLMAVLPADRPRPPVG
jgi:signal peptidase II